MVYKGCIQEEIQVQKEVLVGDERRDMRLGVVEEESIG